MEIELLNDALSKKELRLLTKARECAKNKNPFSSLKLGNEALALRVAKARKDPIVKSDSDCSSLCKLAEGLNIKLNRYLLLSDTSKILSGKKWTTIKSYFSRIETTAVGIWRRGGVASLNPLVWLVSRLDKILKFLVKCKDHKLAVYMHNYHNYQETHTPEKLYDETKGLVEKGEYEDALDTLLEGMDISEK